jgi:hypothetical protein
MTTDQLAVVNYPAPALFGSPCPECSGSGLTGERYEAPGGAYPLLVDVLCPTCLGCGNADHDRCRVSAHADPEGIGFDPSEWDDDGQDGDAHPCPECRGRTWNPMQGYDDSGVKWLRVPCGACMSDRVRLVAR